MAKTKTNENEKVTVINRSAGKVVYTIKNRGIRRELQMGQPIRVPKAEIEELSYEPGGLNLIRHYLYVKDDEILDNLNITVEPEYKYDAAKVSEIILKGSVDEFKDMVDYAPLGVIDMIQQLSVELPMTDLQKCEYLLEKTGYDVQKALLHVREERDAEAEERNEKPVEKETKQRRTSTKTGRRVAVKEETAE